MREDGTAFTDVMVHWWLRQNGFENVGGEWFRCTVGDVRAAMYALKSGTENEEHRTEEAAPRHFLVEHNCHKERENDDCGNIKGKLLQAADQLLRKVCVGTESVDIVLKANQRGCVGSGVQNAETIPQRFDHHGQVNNDKTDNKR